MLKFESKFAGMDSNEIVKEIYTIGSVFRSQFRIILEQYSDVVKYQEVKGLVNSGFHVIAPVWFLRDIEERLARANSQHRIIKTRKKNIANVMNELENYAFSALVDNKGVIQVTFPSNDHVDAFEHKMKERKIRVKVKRG